MSNKLRDLRKINIKQLTIRCRNGPRDRGICRTIQQTSVDNVGDRCEDESRRSNSNNENENNLENDSPNCRSNRRARESLETSQPLIVSPIHSHLRRRQHRHRPSSPSHTLRALEHDNHKQTHVQRVH